MIAFGAAERRRTLVVALLFAALTALFAWPLSARPADRVMSASPDTNLFMWTLAWDVHAFTHQPLDLFDANIYYPLRRTLAYSENLVGSAIVAAPILWTTGNPVLAMNLVALLAAAMCGVGAYALARQVGLAPAAAIVSGLVFAFSPPRFLRLDQLHLATMQWVPFGLASLHAYLDGGRPFDLRLAAAFFTLQALTSGHGAVFLASAMLALVTFEIVVKKSAKTAEAAEKGLALRSPRSPRSPGTIVRDFGITGFLLLAPAVLSFVPYVMVQREAGLRRTLENWTVSPASYLASPAQVHRWLLSFAPAARINERADAYLFPGVLPLVLAACALTRVRRRETRFYALLTLVSVWLTLGPPIGLWPLVYWLPGLNFIRAPSRFMLLAILGLAILSGFGLERVVRSRFRVFVCSWLHVDRWLAAVVAALLALEFAAFPLGVEPYRVEIPAIDRWLASQPKPFVVAEVPLPRSTDLGAWERRHTAFMLHSTAHWQKTVHGYSGLRLPLHAALYDALQRFPDEQSLASLEQLDVTYVVVHGGWLGPGDRAELDARLARFGDRLRLEHAEGEGRVYAVVSASTRTGSR